MINGKTVLAIIPARGGSKGVLRKNIRLVAGKPLIAWTIDEAKKSKYIDRLILTSEDNEIIRIAEEYGCEAPFIRPIELAQDDTPGIEPVIHAIKLMPSYDYVVLLQPTSPLRTQVDIDKCLELCLSKHANACVSVTVPDKSPYWMFTVNTDGMMKPFQGETKCLISRRQELPVVYALNGAIYVSEMATLLRNKTFITKETLAYEMSKYSSVDIDTETDLLIVEALLSIGRI